MGRIFNQKEWLEELDETGPEKRRKASNYNCKSNKITGYKRTRLRNFHIERIELTCRCGTNFVEGLLFVRGMVYCKMSGEYEVAF